MLPIDNHIITTLRFVFDYVVSQYEVFTEGPKMRLKDITWRRDMNCITFWGTSDVRIIRVDGNRIYKSGKINAEMLTLKAGLNGRFTSLHIGWGFVNRGFLSKQDLPNWMAMHSYVWPAVREMVNSFPLLHQLPSFCYCTVAPEDSRFMWTEIKDERPTIK